MWYVMGVKIHTRVFNDVYIPYLNNRSRYEIFYGGAGSGKSVFVAQRMLVRAMKERGHKTLVVRKVAKTNRHSTFALITGIMRQWNIEQLFKVNKSDMEITCLNGNQIIFTGLDDVEKLKSIANITDIWVEEASEISHDDFKQLDLRLRGKTPYPLQITLTFNPISALLWHKAYFFDNPKDNTVILKTTYLDNKFLDDEYKQVINNLQHEDKTYYNIYGLGEWGVLGNLIYSNWEVVSDVPASFDEIIWGLDFGFNNPSALLKIGIKDGNLYLLDEMYKTGLTNQDLIKELRHRVPTNEAVYADSAEPARIEEIKRAGFRVYPAQKDVADGLDFVKRQRLFIHKTCANVIKEIQGYKYKEDKDGNVLDEPVKFADHLMDAMRYAIYTHLWRPKTFSLKVDII